MTPSPLLAYDQASGVVHFIQVEAIDWTPGDDADGDVPALCGAVLTDAIVVTDELRRALRLTTSTALLKHTCGDCLLTS